MYLPAMRERRKAERTDDAGQPELKGGSETIMLVDDDVSILRTTRELLESFGYTVLAASSGEEALEILASKQPDTSMIIMDLGMPGMGGRKCLAEVLRLYPSMKVLIASGYDAAEEQSCNGAAGYLRKPFRMKDLLSEVRKILG
jgi:CheY-like chemotaxis protein